MRDRQDNSFKGFLMLARILKEKYEVYPFRASVETVKAAYKDLLELRSEDTAKRQVHALNLKRKKLDYPIVNIEESEKD